MQANSIRIDSWDALFTMFTTLKPEGRKMSVLQAIADPRRTIGHSWRNCLFAVASQATGSWPELITADVEIVAKALGIRTEWVMSGIRVWDGQQVNERPLEVMEKEFRRRIREHIADLKKAQRAAKTADKAMEQARRANRFVERIKQDLAENVTAAPPPSKGKKVCELVNA